MIKVGQVVYYPVHDTDKESVAKNGDILKDFYPLKSLGIQTVPGVKIRLNNNPNTIIIGHTGIYELEDIGEKITNVSIDSNSISLLKRNGASFVIYDFTYER